MDLKSTIGKMFIRRFYRCGFKYNRTYTDEYIKDLIEKLGEEEAMNIDNAEYAIVLENPEEERIWFFESCQRVLDNTRWYLDNLENVPTFKVNVKNIFPEKKRNLYK